MHQHTLETPLKVSRIYFVLQYWQVSTIFSIFIVEKTRRRLKVIYVYAYHQDIYTYFFEMMPYVDPDTSNAIKILLSGNAQKQKIEEILTAALDRVCPTRSPGKVRWRQAPISQPCLDLPEVPRGYHKNVKKVMGFLSLYKTLPVEEIFKSNCN